MKRRNSYVIQWVVPNRKFQALEHTKPVHKTKPSEYLFALGVLFVASYLVWGIMFNKGYQVEPKGILNGQSRLYRR
jgi:hypothetical protein